MPVYNLQSNALTTLERLKLELNITDDSKDTLLCELINAYSTLVESITGRSFELKEYTELYTGTNTQFIILNNFPVVEVSEVKIDDEVLDSEEYSLLGRIPRKLFRNKGWMFKSFVKGMSNIPVFRDYNIQISYKAGYVLPNDTNPPEILRTLPYDLEKAVINLISIDLAREGTSKGLKTFKISDVSWDFGIGSTDFKSVQQISPSDYAIILKYRSTLL